MNFLRNRHVTRRDFIRTVSATTAAMAVDWTQINAFASAIENKEDLPVVVIGGGLGGLSSAAIFARKGFPVTLVEQHNVPGGYATTFDRAQGKFTFEVSLHATSGVSGGPMRKLFEETGILDKVDMVELPELCRIVSPDQDITWPHRRPQDIIDMVCERFPAQTEGIKGFFKEMEAILAEARKPVDRDSWWDRLLFPITHKRMWAIRNETLDDVMDRYDLDAEARSLLSAFWGYYGLPPSRLSGFLYMIATGAYIWYGGHYVKNRSQDLSNALVTSIEQAGGRVLLETQAVEITMKDRAVSGVRLDDGKTLPARVVVSNVNTPATMKMLPQDPAPADYSDTAREYIETLRTYRPSLSTFVVWLGLNKEIRGKVSGYEIFAAENPNPEEAYQAALACDPKRSGIGVCIYDNAFPGYSRPGTSTVTVIMLSGYDPWRQFEADYFAGRKDAYLKEKVRITEELISKAEKLVIPGLRSMIEIKEAATPLTNVRYTNNPEGAICGYENSLDNSYMNRIDNLTPFNGLYLASAWGGAGGGYQPCLNAGLMAFKAFVKDWGGNV